MKGKFLTKKTKITIREEKEPNGLKVASTARKESGTFNTDALKNFDKKCQIIMSLIKTKSLSNQK